MFVFSSFINNDDNVKFEFLFNNYKNLLYKKSFEILNKHSLAEEAVSESFIRIYKNLNKVKDLDSNSTICFLVTIVKNVSITILNKENKNQTTLYNDEFEVKDNYSLEKDVLNKIDLDMIELAIKDLKEDLRTPFIFKYVYNYSNKDIAELLKISSNSATVKLHRAKKKLLKILNERGVYYE